MPLPFSNKRNNVERPEITTLPLTMNENRPDDVPSSTPSGRSSVSSIGSKLSKKSIKSPFKPGRKDIIPPSPILGTSENHSSYSPNSPVRLGSPTKGKHSRSQSEISSPTAISVTGHDEVSRGKLGLLQSDMPDIETVENQFELFLADMALPSQKQAQMRAFEAERKWKLISQHSFKFQSNDVSSVL